MKSIFLLEDNESLGRSLDERLAQEGYVVTWVTSIEKARVAFPRATFSLAILDVALPDGSGFEFARSVVQLTQTPIIFLSAFSTAEYRLEGFDSGASDFIPKPFHLRELLVRIGKVLEKGTPRQVVKVGDFAIHLDERCLRNNQGAQVFLGPREFELLSLLIANSPRAVSRDEIVEQVWGKENTSASPRTVDNTVVRLRQLLGEEGSRCIRSVRGIGYQWVQ